MLESWVHGANDPTLGLGLHHLPYTAFLSDTGPHLAVAIGACLLDLHAAAPALPAALRATLCLPTLNSHMAEGPASWASLREALQFLLSTPNRDRTLLEAALVPLRTAQLLLPSAPPNYTDFYASIHHARRVGELFRPDEPLLPNYTEIPIAYHGRASSLILTGTPFHRPSGQLRRGLFAPTDKLDYELELALHIGPGNPLGTPIPIDQAQNHLFGVSLLNDWSARDIQSWEYRPLGPFLGKSFATSLSPFITPAAALTPFAAPAPPHDPPPLPYLQAANPTALGIALTVLLSTPASRAANLPPFQLSQSHAADLFWTPAQMIAHHTSNGCNLLPGDVLGTGTISGPSPASAGCLLELTRNGTAPVTLPNGETRAFLLDGDEIILTGRSAQPGLTPLTLGGCRTRILPANP